MRIRDKTKEAEFFVKNYPAEMLAANEPSSRSRLWVFIRSNPKLVIQLVVVIMVLAAERIKLGQRMNEAGQTIEKMRGIADILTGTIESVKTASEAPSKIGQVLNL